jgi:hypothetical protein
MATEHATFSQATAEALNDTPPNGADGTHRVPGVASPRD